MVRSLLRKTELISWPPAEVNYLRKQIRIIKLEGCKTISNYLASGMCTKKWHALGHLPKTLKGLRGIQFIHAVLYRAAHKGFKISYQKKSQLKLSDTKQVITCENRFSEHPEMYSNQADKLGRVNAPLGMAVYNDEAVRFRSAEKSTLAAFEKCTFANQETKRVGSTHQVLCKVGKRLFNRL